MILQVKYSTQFKKDLKLASKQKRNLELLFVVIEKIANLELLSQKFKNHYLMGNYDSYQECHIGPDFLLIYKVDYQSQTLVLTRLGTHSELFNK